jgi:hypothetical protein
MELASGEFVPNLEHQISIHLSSNHYPAVPQIMVQPCIEAINACNEDDVERMIDLPEGTNYKGSEQAPAWSIVQAYHLEFWLDPENF